jgi:hypothetical protein
MKPMTIFLSLAFASQAFALPHLDLEMTSAEYRKILPHTKSDQLDDPAITNALTLGERLSKWIAKVNTGRTASTAIRLTSATTRRGIPIDKPNKYSPSIIKSDTEAILKDLPAQMREVLTGSMDLPGTIPLDDETFITHARKVDRNYQSAARYKSVDVYRSEYARMAAKDVRGYYYLSTNKITENELRDVALIPADKVAPIKEALALICLNTTGVMSPCKSLVTKAFNTNTVAALYSKYFPAAKANWDEFFDIPSFAKRSDIKWSGNTATVPFNTPSIAKFGPYLKDNIEDEYRWNGWGLKLNFGSYSDGPYLKFESGVVPHVNALGGNEIVMDSNQPIEEYESQWTIRHEFGHVLGLPDCYHEFYDTSAKAYVNYQLDITDLMCSRAGNMKERIYDELKEAYGKK